MTIRHEASSDIDAITKVVTAAFGQADEAHLVEALRDAPDFDPELSLIAIEGDAVVGHALLTVIAIETAGGLRPALGLAPVSVAPGWQRQGVGSALTGELLRRARDVGHAAVIVLGLPEYYPRFGFAPASRFGIRAPFDVPDEAFMALELEPRSLAECAGTVRYPPAFGV
jgi:predicted N-acetyltransferase YhbS